MTLKQINTMINSIGLSYAYHHFEVGQAPSLPYLVFYYPGSEDFLADGLNYQPINDLRIELYTEEKDFTKETAVETVLQSNGLIYTKEEVYIESERMYEIIYETEVIINGEQS